MLDIISGPLKSYLTQSIQYYLSQYIEDDVSLDSVGGVFGGEWILRDLTLKPIVTNRGEAAVARGHIRELRILIPWTKLLSQPISISIDSIEFIIAENSEDFTNDGRAEVPPPPTTNSTSTTDRWMQNLLNKVLGNVSIHLTNAMVKYRTTNQSNSIELSVAVESLRIESSDPSTNWQEARRGEFQEPLGITQWMSKAAEVSNVCVFLTGGTDKKQQQVPILNRGSALVRFQFAMLPLAFDSRSENRETSDDSTSYPSPFRNTTKERKWSHFPQTLVVDILIQNLPLCLSSSQVQMLYTLVDSVTTEKTPTENKEISSPPNFSPPSDTKSPKNESWLGWAFSNIVVADNSPRDELEAELLAEGSEIAAIEFRDDDYPRTSVIRVCLEKVSLELLGVMECKSSLIVMTCETLLAESNAYDIDFEVSFMNVVKQSVSLLSWGNSNCHSLYYQNTFFSDLISPPPSLKSVKPLCTCQNDVSHDELWVAVESVIRHVTMINDPNDSLEDQINQALESLGRKNQRIATEITARVQSVLHGKDFQEFYLRPLLLQYFAKVTGHVCDIVDMFPAFDNVDTIRKHDGAMLAKIMCRPSKQVLIDVCVGDLSLDFKLVEDVMEFFAREVAPSKDDHHDYYCDYVVCLTGKNLSLKEFATTIQVCNYSIEYNTLNDCSCWQVCLTEAKFLHCQALVFNDMLLMYQNAGKSISRIGNVLVDDIDSDFLSQFYKFLMKIYKVGGGTQKVALPETTRFVNMCVNGSITGLGAVISDTTLPRVFASSVDLCCGKSKKIPLLVLVGSEDNKLGFDFTMSSLTAGNITLNVPKLKDIVNYCSKLVKLNSASKDSEAQEQEQYTMKINVGKVRLWLSRWIYVDVGSVTTQDESFVIEKTALMMATCDDDNCRDFIMEPVCLRITEGREVSIIVDPLKLHLTRLKLMLLSSTLSLFSSEEKGDSVNLKLRVDSVELSLNNKALMVASDISFDAISCTYALKVQDLLVIKKTVRESQRVELNDTIVSLVLQYLDEIECRNVKIVMAQQSSKSTDEKLPLISSWPLICSNTLDQRPFLKLDFISGQANVATRDIDIIFSPALVLEILCTIPDYHQPHRHENKKIVDQSGKKSFPKVSLDVGDIRIMCTENDFRIGKEFRMVEVQILNSSVDRSTEVSVSSKVANVVVRTSHNVNKHTRPLERYLNACSNCEIKFKEHQEDIVSPFLSTYCSGDDNMTTSLLVDVSPIAVRINSETLASLNLLFSVMPSSKDNHSLSPQYMNTESHPSSQYDDYSIAIIFNLISVEVQNKYGVLVATASEISISHSADGGKFCINTIELKGLKKECLIIDRIEQQSNLCVSIEWKVVENHLTEIMCEVGSTRVYTCTEFIQWAIEFLNCFEASDRNNLTSLQRKYVLKIVYDGLNAVFESGNGISVCIDVNQMVGTLTSLGITRKNQVLLNHRVLAEYLKFSLAVQGVELCLKNDATKGDSIISPFSVIMQGNQQAIVEFCSLDTFMAYQDDVKTFVGITIERLDIAISNRIISSFCQVYDDTWPQMPSSRVVLQSAPASPNEVKSANDFETLIQCKDDDDNGGSSRRLAPGQIRIDQVAKNIVTTARSTNSTTTVTLSASNDSAVIDSTLDNLNCEWKEGEHSMKWMSIQWMYPLPRRILQLVVDPIPLPPERVPKNWPFMNLSDDTAGLYRFADVYCELRYLEEGEFVTAMQFYVPIMQHPTDQRFISKRYLEERETSGGFVYALSKWLEEQNDITEKKDSYSPFFNQSRVVKNSSALESSKRWELCWRCPTSTTNEISSLLVSCIKLQSTEDLDKLNQREVSVSIPTLRLSLLERIGMNYQERALLNLDDSTLMMGDQRNSTQVISIASTARLQVEDFETHLQYIVVEPILLSINKVIRGRTTDLDIHSGPVFINLNQKSILILHHLTSMITEQDKDCLTRNRIHVCNYSGRPVVFGQVGTSEAVTLNHFQSVPYTWRELPTEQEDKVIRHELRFGLSNVEWGTTDISLSRNGIYSQEVDGGKMWVVVRLRGLETLVKIRSDVVFLNSMSMDLSVGNDKSVLRQCGGGDYNIFEHPEFPSVENAFWESGDDLCKDFMICDYCSSLNSVKVGIMSQVIEVLIRGDSRKLYSVQSGSNSFWFWVITKPVWCASYVDVLQQNMIFAWKVVEFVPVARFKNELTNIAMTVSINGKEIVISPNTGAVRCYENPNVDWNIVYNTTNFKIPEAALLTEFKQEDLIVLDDNVVCKVESIKVPTITLKSRWYVVNNTFQDIWISSDEESKKLCQDEKPHSVSKEFRIGLQDYTASIIEWSDDVIDIMKNEETDQLVSISPKSSHLMYQYILSADSTSSLITVSSKVLISSSTDFDLKILLTNGYGKSIVDASEALKLEKGKTINLPSYCNKITKGDTAGRQRKNSSFDWIYQTLVSSSSKENRDFEKAVCFGISMESVLWSEEIVIDASDSTSLTEENFHLEVGTETLSVRCTQNNGALSILIYVDRQPEVIIFNNLPSSNIFIQGHYPVLEDVTGICIAANQKVQGDFAMLMSSTNTTVLLSPRRLQRAASVIREKQVFLRQKSDEEQQQKDMRRLAIKLENHYWSKALWLTEGLQFVPYETTTIVVNINYRAGTFVINLDTVDSMKKPVSVLRHEDEFKMTVEVDSVRVSLYDEQRMVRHTNASHTMLLREVLQLQFHMIQLCFNRSSTPPTPSASRAAALGYMDHVQFYETSSLIVGKVLVEHFLPFCRFPIVLTFDDQHTSDHHGIEIKVVRVIPHDSNYILPYFLKFGVGVTGTLKLEGEDKLFYSLAYLLFPVFQALHSKVLPRDDDDTIQQHKIYCQEVCISDVTIVVTARSCSALEFGFENSRLHFSQVRLEKLYSPGNIILKDLAANYVADAIMRSPLILGSLDIIGNPAGFVNDIGSGLYDFLTLPFQRGESLSQGMYDGVASLLKHFSAGTLGSISSFGSSIARNMNPPELENEHVIKNWKPSVEDCSRDHDPAGLTRGMADGIHSIGTSIVGAATGIITTPLAHSSSVTGLVKGMGLGLLGAVTRPAGGVANFVAQTSQGLLTSAGMGRVSSPSQSAQWLCSPQNRRMFYQWKMDNEIIVYCSEASVTVLKDTTIVEVVLARETLYLMLQDSNSVLHEFHLSRTELVSSKNPSGAMILVYDQRLSVEILVVDKCNRQELYQQLKTVSVVSF